MDEDKSYLGKEGDTLRSSSCICCCLKDGSISIPIQKGFFSKTMCGRMGSLGCC